MPGIINELSGEFISTKELVRLLQRNSALKELSYIGLAQKLASVLEAKSIKKRMYGNDKPVNGYWVEELRSQSFIVEDSANIDKLPIKRSTQKSSVGKRKIYANQLAGNQKGLCAICAEPFNNRINLDHDHDNGLIRAALCSRCNTFMAAIDDTVWLAKGVAYREYWREHHAKHGGEPY